MLKNHFLFITILSLFIFSYSCSKSDDNNQEPEKEIDETPPTITCMDNIHVTIAVHSDGTEVNYDTPVGTDNYSGAKTKQTSGLASGSKFLLGTTTNTFVVTDAAGNESSCSFDVIVSYPEENMPYSVDGLSAAPVGKKWIKVEELSDEFNGAEFDDTKWHRDPASDPFGWYGRPPALFESDNVSVNNGYLNITVEKFDSPKTVNNKSWTYGGAILRSKSKAKYGQYYECRMQANKTVMSSTFWIAYPQNCTTGPIRKLELDIQECVGRIHEGTHSWASNFANIYASNTWRHDRACDTEVDGAKQSPAKTILNEKNNSRFFVYGCWWKSPNEMIFYLDGKQTHTITNPPADFDIEGYITMAIETYDWNPIDSNNDIIATGSIDDRTTKYDWVRTWKLEDQ
ncbi:HYR domain-containing protein [Tamlana fucoidanivorans]|uniref:HYR domain-containing protein n=1 Tax=Allotamlana fucoidanivorans TaxID=2583814 RepID=A0A5C4SRC4_9FLAO|nr:HYR domain-containing protein [Tamlana fucoidanivorans]TNJ46399.1 HYR domain-containing protein [Tamlana fucoidanivorans]